MYYISDSNASTPPFVLFNRVVVREVPSTTGARKCCQTWRQRLKRARRGCGERKAGRLRPSTRPELNARKRRRRKTIYQAGLSQNGVETERNETNESQRDATKRIESKVEDTKRRESEPLGTKQKSRRSGTKQKYRIESEPTETTWSETNRKNGKLTIRTESKQHERLSSSGQVQSAPDVEAQYMPLWTEMYVPFGLHIYSPKVLLFPHRVVSYSFRTCIHCVVWTISSW